MPKPIKKPYEIPKAPDDPEIKPPEEKPTRTWPEKTPEIVPETEPAPKKPPYEIPSPGDDVRFKLNSL